MLLLISLALALSGLWLSLKYCGLMLCWYQLMLMVLMQCEVLLDEGLVLTAMIFNAGIVCR
jgi:hypothetical protein